MRYLVLAMIVLLIVLHQDYWQWDDATLLFGFLPFSLAYHMGLSLAAAIVWALAVRFCWPNLPGDGPADSAQEGSAK